MKKRIWLKFVEEMRELTPKEYYKEQFNKLVEEIKENRQKFFYPH